MTLEAQVRSTLESAAIAYALISAGAMATIGVIRSTADIDLLTTDPRALAPSIWAALVASEAIVDIRHGDADDPLAGLVRVSRSSERPVDLVIGRGSWQDLPDLPAEARALWASIRGEPASG